MNKMLMTSAVAALLLAGLLPESADAAYRRRYRKPAPQYDFFVQEYDSQGFPVQPTNPEQRARQAIWQRDRNRDHKLTLGESGLTAKDFAALDTNQDGWLDLKEMTAYFRGQTGASSAGSSQPSKTSSPNGK